MQTTDYYIQELHKHYPQLSIDTVTLNQDGQYNDVLMVNDELVFRFAKVPDAIPCKRRCLASRMAIWRPFTMA